MAEIRDLSFIANKWKDVTPRRDKYYEAGISNPKKDWAENTEKGNVAWEEGVAQAIKDKRFEKGVAKAGTERWKSRALEKGAKQGRWKKGVEAFADEYAKGFAPFHEVIKNTELPQRYAKGDERNIERVREIAMALHKKKLELYG